MQLKQKERILHHLLKKQRAIGIPVVAHLGLTPQSVGVMGYKLQGATRRSSGATYFRCENVEQAGAVALST